MRIFTTVCAAVLQGRSRGFIPGCGCTDVQMQKFYNAFKVIIHSKWEECVNHRKQKEESSHTSPSSAEIKNLSGRLSLEGAATREITC